MAFKPSFLILKCLSKFPKFQNQCFFDTKRDLIAQFAETLHPQMQNSKRIDFSPKLILWNFDHVNQNMIPSISINFQLVFPKCPGQNLIALNLCNTSASDGNLDKRAAAALISRTPIDLQKNQTDFQTKQLLIKLTYFFRVGVNGQQ